MAGPMVTCVSGKSSNTASAITCAQSWRSNANAASSLAVTSATTASVSIGRDRSHSSPSTTASNAAFANPWPISLAIVAAVTGPSYDRTDPSGSVIFGIVSIYLCFNSYANGHLIRHDIIDTASQNAPKIVVHC